MLLNQKNLFKKGLKACVHWKLHLAYPASLQARPLKTLKQILQMQHNRIKNPNWQVATSWLFTRVAKDLNLGQPRTNSASGRSKTRTRDHQITSLTCRPLKKRKRNTLLVMIFTEICQKWALFCIHCSF